MASIKSTIPFELTPQNLTSGSEYVVRRRQVELPANEATSFGSGTYANQLGIYRSQFNIGSSGIEYLDGMNSYMRLKLSVEVESQPRTGAANGNDKFLRAFLDEGGIHSLIRTLTIQLRNGTRIEHIENYNKVYAVLSNLRHNAEHIDSVESAQSGDSMGYKPYLDPYRFHTDNAVILPANSQVLGQLGTITASAMANLPQADATNAANAAAINAAIDVAANNVRTLTNARLNQVGLIEPARLKFGAKLGVTGADPGVNVAAETVNAVEHWVTFKPMSNFLQHSKFIPLPFLQQLQVVIEWERPNIGLFMDKCVRSTGAALAQIYDSDILNYKVSSPVFVANMVEPSPAITNMMEKQFMGDGIPLAFLSYKTNRKLETGTNINQEISSNFRSARFVLTTFMEDLAFTESNASKAYRCNSTFRKSGLKDWVFKSGGQRWPESGPVLTSISGASYMPAETFTLAQIAVNSHGSVMHDTRIRQWEYQDDYKKFVSNATNGNGTQIWDSTKFIIGAALSRGDSFTGADLTNNSLFLEANFDNGVDATTYFQNKNVFTIISFDAVLTISKASGAVVRY